jgi:hypothetical protein
VSDMFDSTRQIKAKDLREGDTIVYSHSTSYVDEVEWTRDDEILVRTGIGGTGTDWFYPYEIVHIK